MILLFLLALACSDDPQDPTGETADPGDTDLAPGEVCPVATGDACRLVLEQLDSDGDGDWDVVVDRTWVDGELNLERTDADGDGVFERVETYTYVDGDLTLLTIDEDADGVPEERSEYVYSPMEDGTVFLLITQYDEAGEVRLISYTQRDAEGRLLELGLDFGGDGDLDVTDVNTYDDAGHLVLRMATRPPPNYDFEERWTYDAQERLVHHTALRPGEDDPYLDDTYTWAGCDRVASVEIDEGDARYCANTYDDQGRALTLACGDSDAGAPSYLEASAWTDLGQELRIDEGADGEDDRVINRAFDEAGHLLRWTEHDAKGVLAEQGSRTWTCP